MPDSLAVLRQLILRPDRSFEDALVRATDTSGWPIEVTQQLADFAERVRDLSIDEVQELHDETFNREPAPVADHRRRGTPWPISPETVHEDWGSLTRWLSRAEPAALRRETPPAAVLDVIVRLQRTLVAARNPYHHVLAALYAFLQGAPPAA